jgi:hypothetical protein
MSKRIITHTNTWAPGFDSLVSAIYIVAYKDLIGSNEQLRKDAKRFLQDSPYIDQSIADRILERGEEINAKKHSIHKHG